MAFRIILILPSFHPNKSVLQIPSFAYPEPGAESGSFYKGGEQVYSASGYFFIFVYAP